MNHKDTPLQVIREAIYKSIRNSKEFKTDDEKKRVVEQVTLSKYKNLPLKLLSQFQNQYLLKVAGSDQYFLKNCQISQYKYIRQCIAKADTPHLMLMSKDRVYSSLPSSEFHMPGYMRKVASSSTPSQVNVQTDSLWRVNHSFRLHILWATYVNVKDVDLIYVRVGVYHGTEPLCPERQSRQVGPADPKWDEWIDLELQVPDIPRSAKLCLSICSIKKRKGREEHTMLSWGNINLFDFKHRWVGKVFTENYIKYERKNYN